MMPVNQSLETKKRTRNARIDRDPGPSPTEEFLRLRWREPEKQGQRPLLFDEAPNGLIIEFSSPYVMHLTASG